MCSKLPSCVAKTCNSVVYEALIHFDGFWATNDLRPASWHVAQPVAMSLKPERRLEMAFLLHAYLYVSLLFIIIPPSIQICFWVVLEDVSQKVLLSPQFLGHSAHQKNNLGPDRTRLWGLKKTVGIDIKENGQCRLQGNHCEGKTMVDAWKQFSEAVKLALSSLFNWIHIGD